MTDHFCVATLVPYVLEHDYFEIGVRRIISYVVVVTKNGLGKNGPAEPIMHENIVQLDHSWPIINGPARQNLVTKVVRPDQT